jgi:hypothetical protein
MYHNDRFRKRFPNMTKPDSTKLKQETRNPKIKNGPHILTWEVEARGSQTPKNLLDIKTISCQVLVVHTYNPSYSGGRDQEDRGS